MPHHCRQERHDGPGPIEEVHKTREVDDHFSELEASTLLCQHLSRQPHGLHVWPPERRYDPMARVVNVIDLLKASDPSHTATPRRPRKVFVTVPAEQPSIRFPTCPFTMRTSMPTSIPHRGSMCLLTLCTIVLCHDTFLLLKPHSRDRYM